MWRSDRWSSLVDGSDCPICVTGAPRHVLVEFEGAWVTAQPDAPLPGYVCVVAKRHVTEIFELEPAEGVLFWGVLQRVARGLREATAAVKLNYEIHGNTIPHLHVHLYPRFPGDPFEGQPIDPSVGVPFHRTADDLAKLRTAIGEQGRD